MIKFWSYNREYSKYKRPLLRKINKTLLSGTIFFGNELSKFEKNFIKKNNAKYGVAVGSGTDALLIALKSIGVKMGDEIITVANTAIPTISAIINSGATPKLIDINHNYLIDVQKIEKEINSRTKAIIPVHLYGQPCDMDSIIKISKKYNIPIIEDCAQAQGAIYKKKIVGNFGKFGCFSFYPTKILGAYGDGGFITTNDYKEYKKIKRIRFYGIETENKNNKYNNKYYANENGVNSRLDEIQATVLNYKLEKLSSFINRRREIAKLYLKELTNTDLTLPIEDPNVKHVYHLFTVSHPNSREIVSQLKKEGVETRKIYPFPIHTMKAYRKIINNKKKLRMSEIKSKSIFCLPLYPELKNKEVKIICKILKKILKNIKKN
jgi:dTDP-3-amino-2,3,6-trideoxy-4-keto-D-glucose/dTDP-3-amino-3,4,6-trideoxy-alpha-D-glucose/dTDP-2,6-dideoxy-D-kanosamine transaminase|tara:strand:+ start:245 stop:1381 length:1137 start_codon:yes stop_codon:yes gene_type:complete